MKVLVNFIAFYWDNYQGGSGRFSETHLLVEIEDAVCAFQIWEKIHDKIKEHLKKVRPFDQTVYSKNQSEYSITKVELL